ncbi:hypothetical protein HZ993_21830 [Rhodoferax sp. AJA081-3]|uniref:hypothetical protein n=1 Tax=Rhodoferax sp. AJA081-3 TaxID=2752316 RepID=UPI001ADF188D|nr:hypothetical protein [Rhodoferax sp. AJA081-3]QTN27865.1 hypothetical protein HZ993_21830 [Rhodoferax sp. AJA081-3]
MRPPHPDLAVPTVLDVEASGFGRNSYPIEIGFVLPNGHTFCTLVRPEAHWTHWDAQAEATHHISRALILARGVPVPEVARTINAQLYGQTVYSDGWVNDYSWIGALFDAADMSPSFKLENLRVLLDDQEADQWHTVKAQVSSERGVQRHRASADARLLQLTLLRLRNGHSP